MIAWITTWGIRCGIATYSKFLVEQMEDVVVLCQSGEGEVTGAIPCWTRDSDFFGGIIAQIAAKGIEKSRYPTPTGIAKILLLKHTITETSRHGCKGLHYHAQYS